LSQLTKEPINGLEIFKEEKHPNNHNKAMTSLARKG